MSTRLTLICSVFVLMALPAGLAAQEGRVVRDADGDGHDAREHGGDDCDDSDPSRFPGNVEVPDRDAHDEDCDPTTFGFEDADGDGYPAAWACNVEADGTYNCGSDCDDIDASIHPTQIDVCNNRDDNCDGSRDEDQPCRFLEDFQEDPDFTMEARERERERRRALRDRVEEEAEKAYEDDTPEVDVPRDVRIEGGAGPNACHDAVQGEIAWDYRGTKRWAATNVERLCEGAERSEEPARCFERVMHGGVEKADGSTRWSWQEALGLCEGTRDADATIACYRDRVERGVAEENAIGSCSGQF